jgi:hypothetical protein
MDRMARLSFADGGLILPAHTPYERELLVRSKRKPTPTLGE